MLIPDFEMLMLPFLRILSDQQEHHIRDVIETLALEFALTPEERKELLPSGQQCIFDSRVSWAKTYLKKAKLLDNPQRGIVKITRRGRRVLMKKPLKVNIQLLRQFDEFKAFQAPKTSRKHKNIKAQQMSAHVAESQMEYFSRRTPEELLENAYQAVRASLARELLNQVLAMSPTFFERLVIELLVKMGYGGSIKDAGKTTKRSSDEGIDGTIKEDKLGLDIIYLQAKKWRPGNVVGRPEIQKFVGALAGQGAKKGIFITTSSFSKEAKNYIPQNAAKIVLIDGEQLTQLMIDFNLGITTQNTYHLKKIDNDYFSGE